MNLKIKTVLFFLLAIATSAFAADISICLQFKDGKSETIILADHPVITFSDEHLHLNLQSIEFSYVLADLKGYNLISEEAYIDRISCENLDIYCNGREIQIPAAKANETLILYSLNGDIISQLMPDVDGPLTISLNILAPGIYILKHGDHSFKFIKQ